MLVNTPRARKEGAGGGRKERERKKEKGAPSYDTCVQGHTKGQHCWLAHVHLHICKQIGHAIFLTKLGLNSVYETRFPTFSPLWVSRPMAQARGRKLILEHTNWLNFEDTGFARLGSHFGTHAILHPQAQGGSRTVGMAPSSSKFKSLGHRWNGTCGVYKVCAVEMALSSSKFHPRLGHKRYALLDWRNSPRNFTIGQLTKSSHRWVGASPLSGSLLAIKRSSTHTKTKMKSPVPVETRNRVHSKVSSPPRL